MPVSQHRICKSLIISTLFWVTATGASAQRMTFSIDFQGPLTGAPSAWLAVPMSEGDILTPHLVGPPGPNPPFPGPLPALAGVEIGAQAGSAGVIAGGLGIIPGINGFVELDALSYGRDLGTRILFSVDEFAIGVPSPRTPDVFTEGAAGLREASADVFAYQGGIAFTPIGVFPGNIQLMDGDGAPGSSPSIGLFEPNPITPGIPDVGDNLDALDIETHITDLTGAVYFSLDSSFADPLEGPPINTGTASGSGFSGADVLVSFAGGVPAVAIPAFALGLDVVGGYDTDDLDALVFNDTDGSGSLTAPDNIYYSVRRGSKVIGSPDSAGGVPIEEGDILTVLPGAPAGTLPAIFIPAEALGLATVRSGSAAVHGDDIDAMDVYLNPTFSTDFQGPVTGFLDSLTGFPVDGGDILSTAFVNGAGVLGFPGPNPAVPAPVAIPGTMITGIPSLGGTFPGGLGFGPGVAGFTELDAMSYGFDDPAGQLVFSVDEFAAGFVSPLAPSDVAKEGAAAAREASADVFEYRGPVVPMKVPIGGINGSNLLIDGNGIGFGPFPIPSFGLVEPNPPSPGLLPDAGDNVDAINLDSEALHLTGPVYFSLSSGIVDFLEAAPANNSTAAFNGFSGADILVSFAGGLPGMSTPAVTLGLDLFGFDTDDVDGLVFNDPDGTASYTPGDTLYFTVRRGSMVIGIPDSLLGVPIEEGDILAPPTAAGSLPQIIIPGEQLGLATHRSFPGPFGSDEVDGLDMINVPEPAWAIGMGVCLPALLALHRRRNRLRPHANPRR